MPAIKTNTGIAVPPKSAPARIVDERCADSEHLHAHDTLDGERLISIRQLSGILAVSTRTIYRLVARGELAPPIQVGGSQRFFASDVAKYLKRLKQGRSRATWLEEKE